MDTASTTGEPPNGTPPPATPPPSGSDEGGVPTTATITRIVEAPDGCRWETEEVPKGATELLATLPKPCETDPQFSVELNPATHKALLIDGGHAFVVDVTAKTATPAPAPPVPDATLGIDDQGLVACAIIATAPDGAKAWVFEQDGQSYQAEEVADGGTSLGRSWRRTGDKWVVTETAVIDSDSPDAGSPMCEDLPSWGVHDLMHAPWEEAFADQDMEGAEAEAIAKVAGEGTYVTSGGEHPIAIKEDWGEGPYWTGPVYIKGPDGNWKALEGTEGFQEVYDGLIFANVGKEYRLYSTVTGEVLWKSDQVPFLWGDLAM